MSGEANESLYRKRKKIDFTLESGEETSDDDWDIAKEARAKGVVPRTVGAKKRVRSQPDTGTGAGMDTSERDAANPTGSDGPAEPVAGPSGTSSGKEKRPLYIPVFGTAKKKAVAKKGAAKKGAAKKGAAKKKESPHARAKAEEVKLTKLIREVDKDRVRLFYQPFRN